MGQIINLLKIKTPMHQRILFSTLLTLLLSLPACGTSQNSATSKDTATVPKADTATSLASDTGTGSDTATSSDTVPTSKQLDTSTDKDTLADTASDTNEDSDDIEQTTIKICSFNIQFLASFKKKDAHAVASVLQPCDVAVIQELVAPPVAVTYPDGDTDGADAEAAAFFAEMDALGFKYVLSEEDTGTSDSMHSAATSTEWWVAFYREEAVQVDDTLPHGFLAEDRFNHDDYERVPYAFGFKTIEGNLDFVLISVHLQPGNSANDKARRRHEFVSIHHWINGQASAEKDYIILGDMNLSGAIEASVLRKNKASLL